MPLCRELVLGRLQGVTVVDPANTYVDPRCTVGEGTVLLPGTILRGETHVAANCEIGPNAMIRDSSIGEGTTVNASQVNESTVGCHTTRHRSDSFVFRKRTICLESSATCARVASP